MLVQPIGWQAQQPPVVREVTYQHYSGSNLSTYMLRLTVPAPGRLVVLKITGIGLNSGARALTAATVGGAALTIVRTNNAYPCAAIVAGFLAGGSHDIAIQFSATCDWMICFSSFLLNATAVVDSGVTTTTSDNDKALTLTHPAGALGLYKSMHMSPNTDTWSGASTFVGSLVNTATDPKWMTSVGAATAAGAAEVSWGGAAARANLIGAVFR